MQLISVLLHQAFAEKGFAAHELEEFVESGALPSKESKIEPYDPAMLKAFSDDIWRPNSGES